uniref:unspecific monooxygenase n=1 Tax=Leptobrachium leishanense TaxID=445787 RepID=A0A8C5QS94_9ANUR
MELFSVTALLLIVCTVFYLITAARDKRQNKARLPPGPTPLPILGNLLQFSGKEVFQTFIKFAEKYGSVYTIYMGLERVVVLCGYDTVKSALIEHGDVFAGRGRMPIFIKMSSGGVISSNGERWKQLRRFSLMTLRNFGLGKRSIEERIQEEAQFLTEEFRKTNGQPVEPFFYLSRAVSNVICSVVFGHRFEYDDQRFLQMLHYLNEIPKCAASVWGQWYNVYPKVMEKIPGPHHRFFQAIERIEEFIREKIKMHQETLDPNFTRDFIDVFLLKMEQEKDTTSTEFHMDALVHTTIDLFAAGTETVSTTLQYGLLILLKHPEVEERIHQEINQVIGRNRSPCVEDRARMPYTDAVIHEIQRFIDLLPLGIPHKVTQDIEFNGYVIPKDTTIYPLLNSVLQDPKQYMRPHEFNPGHFLDDKGKFCRNDAFMPFSAGKRICVGEGLARMELFLFISTILQNFTLKSVVALEDIDLTPSLSGVIKLRCCGGCTHSERMWGNAIPFPFQQHYSLFQSRFELKPGQIGSILMPLKTYGRLQEPPPNNLLHITSGMPPLNLCITLQSLYSIHPPLSNGFLLFSHASVSPSPPPATEFSQLTVI